MRPLLDVEARSRCRKASLVPLTILCAALTEYGRNDATTSILSAVNKMPKRWVQEVCIPSASLSRTHPASCVLHAPAMPL